MVSDVQLSNYRLGRSTFDWYLLVCNFGYLIINQFVQTSSLHACLRIPDHLAMFAISLRL